jgi:hypothetical protein
MQSTYGSQLVGMPTLARVTGGHLPARPEPFSNIITAIAENERLVEKSQAKERLAARKSQQQQSAYTQRYHARDAALEEEARQQQEALENGAVSYALWQIDKQYATRMPEKAPAPMPARIANSSKVITRSTPAPSQRQYITRKAPGGSYTRTVHVCFCGEDARYMQAEGNLGRMWYCKAHKPWAGRL